MIPTDDPLLSGLRYQPHDAPDYGSGKPLALQERLLESPSILEDTGPLFYIDGADSSMYYELLSRPQAKADAVEAIADGRVGAFLAANPIPRADWSLAAYKPPLHPLDGIRFNLAEPA